MLAAEVRGPMTKRNRAKRMRVPAVAKPTPPWTPETKAKLLPPPWADWPDGLRRAAAMVELGYRLRAGEMIPQAFDYSRIPHAAGEDWTLTERAIVRHFLRWSAVMDRRDIPLSPVVDMVVFAVHPSQIVRFLLPARYKASETGAWALLRDALELWDKT